MTPRTPGPHSAAHAPRGPSPLPGDSPSPPSSAHQAAGSSASSYPGGRRGALLSAPLSRRKASPRRRCALAPGRPCRCPPQAARSRLPRAGGPSTVAAATAGSDALTDSLINNNKDTESEQADNPVDETRESVDSSWLFSRYVGRLTGVKRQET
ncbi:uncharacterized protein LOC134173711 isoform X1 [Pezoporus occidentalis]|uniref:uncharacterized protein LOC134173711 isoform X1 n=1 Tax=Pezoporus occidentalis TaxID=407982 RepID=UPI002F9128E9